MKRPRKQKLYSKVINVSLPDSIMEFRGGASHSYRIDVIKIPIAAHVTWPSGRPCLAINMYLLDKGWQHTGESVLTEASKLTELIRYCATGGVDSKPIGFGDLKDNDIGNLIKKLCTDVYQDEPTERLRNNNTVRAIMHTVFDFLIWYEENLNFNRPCLIGTRQELPAIIIEKKFNPHSRHNYITHRYLPPRESHDPKLPIGTGAIEKINAIIDELEFPENYPEPALRKFRGDEKYLSAYLEYLTARRVFMVFMMRATGLRPEEMAQMPLRENSKSIYLNPPMLILPTMKRRAPTPPMRNFQITENQAIRVGLYLRARMTWVAFLKSRYPDMKDSVSMFLSVEPGQLGRPIGKKALEKDFEMLAKKAGFSDQQTCMSMFRHRFVTDLVSMHLKAFDAQQGIMNKQDYRTLLEKVREKTGHRSVNSLWHYIDLVRDMAGVWEPVEKLQSRLHAAEQLISDLRGLQREISKGALNELTSDQIANHVSSKLKEITGGLGGA